MSSKENFAFTVRHSTLEDGDSKAPARALESSMASDPGQVSHLMLSEGEIERPKSADPSSGPPSSLSAKSHPSPSANDLLDRGSSTSTSFDSEDDSLSQSDQDFDSTPSMSPNLDMATPITRTRKAKATPRRDAPVVHLIGAEERSYKPVKSPRKVRFFVFTPQGRALSMSLSRHLHSVSDFLAYASIKLMEQERVVVPRNEPFSNAYFLPSFADLEDLSDIRENDQLVLVTSKLEPGEVLNSIGTTRMRSHSISTLPSPRSGPIASEWSNIVPVVEPSFHSSTKIFERFMTSESERFSKHNFQSALLDHRSRVRDSHIHDIVKRIESFASVGDRACWTTYSTAPAATTFDSFSGASPRAARRPSDFNPTTPRGGIAMQHSLIHHHQKTDVHMTPRSIESTASSLSVTYFSHGTHISPRSDYSGESPRGSRASSEYSSLQVPLSGMSAQQLRHAFEWERSENEIRAVVGAQTVADKWGERDKSKKERSRFLSADEEREAKKLEKRSSKNKADSNRIGGGFAGAGSGGGSGGGKGAFGGGNRSNFFSTGPQKGIIGALGTMPRSKPSGDGGLNSASTSRSSIVDASFDSPEDILMDPSGKVIGLKIEKLLQRLTSDSFPAVSLAKSFLLTYRLYMSPSELLNALEVRWDADGPPPPDPSAKLSNAQIQAQQLTPSRLRLITLVKQWAFKHASEDFEDGVVRNILFSFAAKMERSGVLNLTKEVESALFKKRVSVDNSYSGAFSSSAPNASSAPNSFKSRSNRFSINPSTVIGVSSSSQDPSLPSVADHRSTSQQSSNLQSSNHDLPSPHFPSHSFSASMSDVPPQDDDDSAEAFPTPYIPPFGGEMFDFHPLELARQITLIEKAYLDAIRPQEMLNLAWTKKEKEILAPNVLGTSAICGSSYPLLLVIFNSLLFLFVFSKSYPYLLSLSHRYFFCFSNNSCLFSFHFFDIPSLTSLLFIPIPHPSSPSYSSNDSLLQLHCGLDVHRDSQAHGCIGALYGP